MKEPPVFLDAKAVMELAACSQSKAYQIIRRLNRELEAKGFLTLHGRINRQYFLERFGG